MQACPGHAGPWLRYTLRRRRPAVPVAYERLSWTGWERLYALRSTIDRNLPFPLRNRLLEPSRAPRHQHGGDHQQGGDVAPEILEGGAADDDPPGDGDEVGGGEDLRDYPQRRRQRG